MSSNWFYKGKEVITPEEGYYGFVYLITYTGKSTIEYPKGSIYVGKKSFAHTSRKKLSKKAKLLPEYKGKRILKTTKDSGWKDYYGSSLSLKAFIEQVGKENFTREILCFTKTKGHSTYMELKNQILYRVLEVPSFNKWVGGRVFRHQLQEHLPLN